MSNLVKDAIDCCGIFATVGVLYLAARLGAPYGWPTFYVVGSLVALAVVGSLIGAGVAWIRCGISALRRRWAR